MGLRGIKDLYLTASGISGEAILGNLIFEPMQVVCNQEPCGDPVSSSSKNSKVSLNIHHSVSINNGIYTIHFNKPGNYEVYAINPIGQLMAHRSTNGTNDVQFKELPKGNYIFKTVQK
jgi:hypothetical protein